MSPSGETDSTLFELSRSALLDACEALADHRRAVVVIGAQAIYLQTHAALVALAEATKDSDLLLDPRKLQDHPLLEVAMERAGFYLDAVRPQPGAWLSPAGVPVDLMVPERLAGAGGRRGARIPPHSKYATRRARGLEAAAVDSRIMQVRSLHRSDFRRFQMRVAGPAALLVAKAHKIGDRQSDVDRLVDKDAHDVYRILIAFDTAQLVEAFTTLLGNSLSAEVTGEALRVLGELFATGPDAPGSVMAGRAEEGIGEPETVALSAAVLTADLLDHLDLGQS
jgi:hypothetical protein